MTITFSDIPVLQKSNVKMRNPNEVLSKINCLISGKKENLQVITDYDLTITKQHVNGERTMTSFGLLSLWDELPFGFMAKDMKLKEKYHPIEVDLHMSPEEKSLHMVEWYKDSENLWKGIEINFDALAKLIADKGPTLRTGTVEVCKILRENKIPVVVLSAGLGDVLVEVLKYHGLIENDYFYVVSNFFKLRNNVVEGYGCRETGSYIHPFNKNAFGCSLHFKEINFKSNLILMGDSLGDARMDEGIPDVKTVLKIGFLYDAPNKIEKSLPKFLQCFDIVLVDDQTMDVLRAIIDLIIAS